MLNKPEEWPKVLPTELLLVNEAQDHL